MMSMALLDKILWVDEGTGQVGACGWLWVVIVLG
jgi:hypothetical protein